MTAEKALALNWQARVLIQRGLASLDFDPGPADGAFGPRTRDVVFAWQEAKGYEGTGYLTREHAGTLKAVGEEAQRAVREQEAKAEPERRVREEKRPGRVLRDCGECPEMVVMPAGEYMMGSPQGGSRQIQ